MWDCADLRDGRMGRWRGELEDDEMDEDPSALAGGSIDADSAPGS